MSEILITKSKKITFLSNDGSEEKDIFEKKIDYDKIFDIISKKFNYLKKDKFLKIKELKKTKGEEGKKNAQAKPPSDGRTGQPSPEAQGERNGKLQQLQETQGERNGKLQQLQEAQDELTVFGGGSNVTVNDFYEFLKILDELNRQLNFMNTITITPQLKKKCDDLKNIYYKKYSHLNISRFFKSYTFLNWKNEIYYNIGFDQTSNIYCQKDRIDFIIDESPNELSHNIIFYVVMLQIISIDKQKEYCHIVSPWDMSNMFNHMKIPLIYNHSKQYFEYEYNSDEFNEAFDNFITDVNIPTPPNEKKQMKELLIMLIKFINKEYYYAIPDNHGLIPKFDKPQNNNFNQLEFKLTYPVRLPASLSTYSGMFYSNLVNQRHSFFKNLIGQIPNTSIIGPISMRGGSNIKHPSLHGLVDFYRESFDKLKGSFGLYNKRLDPTLIEKIDDHLNNLISASEEFENKYEIINKYKNTIISHRDPRLNVTEQQMEDFSNSFNNFVNNEVSINKMIQKLQSVLQQVMSRPRINANV